MALSDDRCTFFESGNITIGEIRWAHFKDFKITDLSEGNNQISLGPRCYLTEAITNSSNYGTGAPEPLSRRQYENLIGKLRSNSLG